MNRTLAFVPALAEKGHRRDLQLGGTAFSFGFLLVSDYALIQAAASFEGSRLVSSSRVALQNGRRNYCGRTGLSKQPCRQDYPGFSRSFFEQANFHCVTF